MKLMLVPSFALVLLPLTALLPAQEPELERNLPATTFACLRFAGLESCRQAAQELGLLRLGTRILDQVGTGQLAQLAFRSTPEQAVAKIHEPMRRLGLEPKVVRAALAGPIVIGVGRPTVFRDGILPSVALLADARQRGDSLRTVCARLEAMVVEQSRGSAVREQLEIEGAKFTSLGDPRMGIKVLWGQHGDLFFVSNSASYVKDCIATARAKGPSFADRQVRKQGHAQLRAKELFSLACDLEPLAQAAGLVLPMVTPYEFDEVARAVGVGMPSGFYFAGGVDGRNASEVGHLAMACAKDGLLRATVGAPTSARAATYCPADALVFASVRVDTKALVAGVKRIVAALPAPMQQELNREVGRELGRELRQLGLTLADVEQLAQLVGPEVSLAVTMPFPPFPDVTVFAQVGDPQKAEQLIEMLKTKGRGPAWETTDVNGTTVHHCKVNVGIQLTPAIAIHDGMVVASSKLGVLRNALGQPAKQKSLANDPEFQGLLQKNQGALLLLARADMSLAKTWTLARSGLAMVAGAVMDPELVPTVEEMQAELDDVVVYGRVDGEGLTLRQSSPIGLTALVATAGATLDWVLEQPSLASATPANEPPAKKKIY